MASLDRDRGVHSSLAILEKACITKLDTIKIAKSTIKMLPTFALLVAAKPSPA